MPEVRQAAPFDIVNMVGGLGNQLFQWAFGEMLREAGRSVRYDLSDFESYALHGGAAIERHFDVVLDKITEHDRAALPFMARSRPRKRLAQRLPSLLRPDILTEEDVLRSGLEIRSRRGQYFNGYWQFIEHATGFFGTLPARLRFRDDVSFDGVGDLVGCASVHVRLGDYLASSRTCHLPLDASYYRTAMTELLERRTVERFLIFSDEIKTIRKGWFDGFPVTFVTPDLSANAGSDLQLMSRTRHLIISASSFGWWAGALAGRDAQVVYPRPWVRPPYAAQRRYTPAMPSHWVPQESTGHDLAAMALSN